MPYFNNIYIFFGCLPCVFVCLCFVETTSTREREAVSAPRGNTVALRLAGHPPYALLDTDDRFLHAQPRQAQCISSVRCGKIRFSTLKQVTSPNKQPIMSIEDRLFLEDE